MERTNQQIAEKLNLMAELLEIKGENVFKVRAFSRAADTIDRYGSPLSSCDEQSLASIPGIGKNIARKIREIVETGTFQELEEEKSGIPDSLIELLRLEGIGPKTVSTLWKKLSVQSIDDLEREARNHRIRALRGFGEKKEESYLKAIAVYREQSGRMTRLEADDVVDRIRSAFSPGTYEVAGSYRRGKSTVGDIDVVTTEPAHAVNPRLRSIADAVIDEGEKRTSVRVLGKRVDVRFSRPQQFGSMLLYLTGSKAFNIRLREIAISKGYKLNEYGIEDRAAGIKKDFAGEQEIFSFLSMDTVVPELREDWGEVERALARALPELVRQDEIRGDLHVHSSWSDGRLTIEELARKGEQMGYEYLVCSDHSATLGIAHGLDETALNRQAHEIEAVNRSSSCRIIHGIEVDILADGTLGLPSRALADLEIVIASVHSGFSQERDIMTRRVLSAIESEHVDIIGHPTGRILGRRQPYAIDMDRIIDHAQDTGTALECNASPYRLDIDDVHIRHAIERGVRIAIGTDAHDPSEFDHMHYGVTTCRRGWATASDVLNTRSLNDLLEWKS
ncbi:MAG: DNA polymerase/3'-5' exonuclease PolX [Methanomicrobiales archaeon]|nr:DNA polymerase/3'-5' exonuclease PolX [Methanomicrobiales archaeon]